VVPVRRGDHHPLEALIFKPSEPGESRTRSSFRTPQAALSRIAYHIALMAWIRNGFRRGGEVQRAVVVIRRRDVSGAPDLSPVIEAMRRFIEKHPKRLARSNSAWPA